MNADARWKLAVLELDDWTCQNCGSNTCLDAAHIEPRSRRPDLALDPANGITLCRSCHHFFHDHPYEFTPFTHAFQRLHVSRFNTA
jgi:5-methylcytosine-specific restriction endonuclease McrA